MTCAELDYKIIFMIFVIFVTLQCKWKLCAQHAQGFLFPHISVTICIDYINIGPSGECLGSKN